jgi:2-oxoglutarate ferredoxin oxidoreductase subunit beta
MAEMKRVFGRPEALSDVPNHYCPGCTHGVLHRLVAECIDEFDVLGTAVGVCPVGCSVLAYDYFECDMIQASHGRAPAVATGVKRARPDLFVFAYQGDGDLASIGTAEIVHVANRGEPITVIFVNNAVYGMTGGQMAPTTLIGMTTTTSPFGRDASIAGYPMRMCELLATLEGSAYIARTALSKPREVLNTKKCLKKAFRAQLDGAGFAMVEVLSICPVQWGMAPYDATLWLEENMVPVFPLGEFVNKVDAAKDAPKSESKEAAGAPAP